ncbi:MAG: hypothetical protein V1921_06300 [Candidatus Altiarchaeota archaeon]
MTGTRVVKLRLDDGGTAEKLPKLKEDPVETALGLYEMLRDKPVPEGCFQEAMALTKHLNVSSDELQSIYDRIEGNYLEDKSSIDEAGVFLSALINNSGHHTFVLKPKVLLHYFCYKIQKGKDITVLGNVGLGVGWEMDGGKIKVEGNAGGDAGYTMYAGDLHITGDVESSCGAHMKDGNIYVGGNARNNAGHFMEGGRIHIHGDSGPETGFAKKGGELIVDGRRG